MTIRTMPLRCNEMTARHWESEHPPQTIELSAAMEWHLYAVSNALAAQLEQLEAIGNHLFHGERAYLPGPEFSLREDRENIRLSAGQSARLQEAIQETCRSALGLKPILTDIFKITCNENESEEISHG